MHLADLNPAENLSKQTDSFLRTNSPGESFPMTHPLKNIFNISKMCKKPEQSNFKISKGRNQLGLV